MELLRYNGKADGRGEYHWKHGVAPPDDARESLLFCNSAMLTEHHVGEMHLLATFKGFSSRNAGIAN